MRRFITYLYEYERGHKSKNTGFLRIDIRDMHVKIEVCIRNYTRSNEIGKIYALVTENGLLGIEIGEVKVFGGQGEAYLECATNNIGASGYGIKDIVGIGIRFRNNGYLASCWEDAQADAIAGEEFRIYKIEENLSHQEAPLQTEQVPEVKEPCHSEVFIPQEEMQEEVLEEVMLQQESLDNKDVRYQKIELNQIRSLPSKNWHLCNNSFLIHGFLNYGYLILKKEMADGKEKTSLGVPGVFEKPEMVMAVMFGFPEFEEVPLSMKEVEMNQEKEFANIEKNQEPQAGTYGCWFVVL